VGGPNAASSEMIAFTLAMVGKNSCLHRVRPLTDTSCWEIFMNALTKHKRQVDLATVNSMKDEILKTCSGLPSAAKTMGDIVARSLSSPASTSASQELSKSGHK